MDQLMPLIFLMVQGLMIGGVLWIVALYIERKQEAQCRSSGEFEAKERVTNRGPGAMILALGIGMVLLAAPSAAQAYVDCYSSDLPCREGQVCGWDPGAQIHRCMPAGLARFREQGPALARASSKGRQDKAPVCRETTFGECIAGYGDRLCDHAKGACRYEVAEHNAKCRVIKEAARRRAARERAARKVKRPTAPPAESSAPSKTEQPLAPRARDHDPGLWRWRCSRTVHENDPECRP